MELFLKDFLQYARSPTGRSALVEESSSSGGGGISGSSSGKGTEKCDDTSGRTSSDQDSRSITSDEEVPQPVGIESTVIFKPRSAASFSTKQQECVVSPLDPEFSGFVFKLQANLDPKHRDRMAFVRICSGVFRKGMKVQHSRTRRAVNLSSAQTLFAQEREAVVEAYPGDVIGIHNPGIFAIGDTIYTGSRRVSYPGIPSFSPEKFAYIRNPNPSTYKKFQKVILYPRA